MLTNTLGAVTCRQGIACRNVRNSDKPNRAWKFFQQDRSTAKVGTLGKLLREIKAGERPLHFVPNLIQRNDARAICAHLGPFQLPKGAAP
jgi:hypothetical protein